MTTAAAPLRTFEDAQAVLAATLPGYTRRPGQEALSRFIEQGLSGTQIRTLFAEAGTGIGKSLAYLIPAILSGKSVVVATTTKALQDQLAGKDMPFLEEHLPVPFTWAVLKGKANYLCRAELADLEVMNPELAGRVRQLIDEADGFSGDFTDFPWDVSSDQQRALSISSNDCPGARDCPFGHECFSEMARQKLQDSQVKIVNTTLLMIDLLVRKSSDNHVSLLGNYDLVILDEAHELLDVATNSLGASLRLSSVERLADRAAAFAGVRPEGITSRARILWSQIDGLLHDADGNKEKDGEIRHSWVAEREELISDLVVAVTDLRSEVSSTPVRGVDSLKSARARLGRQLSSLEEKLYDFLLGQGVARWAEREVSTYRGQQREQLIVNIAPVDVAPFLNEMLWSRVPAVLVSATMSVAGDFSYQTRALGVRDPLTFIAPSPFDFESQARLLVPPEEAPIPKGRDMAAWRAYAQEMMHGLVEANADGGALLLFTSTSAMRDAHRALAPRLQRMGRTVLLQGEGSNKALARQFAEDTTSVLFGLKSFFVGVDFQGATCSLVVIDKLPFPVPSDVLFAARCAMIEREHGPRSSFRKLSIPVMAMTLVQGVGRLIRHADDYGVMAILDQRLIHTSWGRQAARALPPAPVISTLNEAREFFAAR